MRAIGFNSNEFYNPGKHIIDPYILFYLLEKICDFPYPNQPNP